MEDTWFGGEQPHFSFHWIAFMIGLFVGILYVYLQSPPLRTVVSHPTPFNAGKIVYKDDAGTCFVFQAKEVPCKGKDAQAHPLATTQPQ